VVLEGKKRQMFSLNENMYAEKNREKKRIRPLAEAAK
jgi:hypothetical protein